MAIESGRVGPNSCSARGCHGAVEPTNPTGGSVFIKDGAYTTWRSYDPHRLAFDVLKEPRSIAIAAKLKIKAAHESRTCLVCHSTVSESNKIEGDVFTNWIDCEGCHGPARSWLEPHVAPIWKTMSPKAKQGQGMTDLSTPVARAESCVPCHVGDRTKGMDVNHDLIAAGHPRLNFEYASYLAALPKHWREPHEKTKTPSDFEARSWAVGQVVTARATLRLLADRANESIAVGPDHRTIPPPWPEFSEYECFACHHDLNSSGYQPDRIGAKLGLGRLPWATWPTAMLPVLAGKREDLNPDSPGSFWWAIKEEMALREPNPATVLAEARRGIAKLDGWLPELANQALSDQQVDLLSKTLARPRNNALETWDEFAQRYLALSALNRASIDLSKGSSDPQVLETIKSSRARLEFPLNYDSPMGGRVKP